MSYCTIVLPPPSEFYFARQRFLVFSRNADQVPVALRTRIKELSLAPSIGNGDVGEPTLVGIWSNAAPLTPIPRYRRHHRLEQNASYCTGPENP
jgi:hypothetical protein